MKKANFYVFTFISFLFLSITCSKTFGQKADFSGTWMQTERNSLSGKDYANGLPSKIKITQEQSRITIERTSLSGNTDSPATIEIEKLNIDGLPATSTTASKRIKSSMIQFTAGKMGFTETSFLNDQNDKKVLFNTSEVWSLSRDGKTLTVVRNFASASDPEDKWSMKGRYEREK